MLDSIQNHTLYSGREYNRLEITTNLGTFNLYVPRNITTCNTAIKFLKG